MTPTQLDWLSGIPAPVFAEIKRAFLDGWAWHSTCHTSRLTADAAFELFVQDRAITQVKARRDAAEMLGG